MVKIVRVVFLFLLLAVTGNVLAEGSKDFYPEDAKGKRAFLVGTTTYSGSIISATSYPFITNGVHYAYVKAGEYISAASSGGGTIRLTPPNGTTPVSAEGYYSGSGGQISNRTEEKNGSRNALGYTGFEKQVLPSEEGVWKIEFIAPGNGGSIPNVDADDDWTDSSDGLIAAWDVSVFADESTTVSQDGRVYANVLNLMVSSDFGDEDSPTNKDVGFYGVHYVLTKDGFAYKVSENGAIGVAFTFFVNNKGFTTEPNGAGTQTYRSVETTSGVNVKSPIVPDSSDGVTHKIFYNKPDYANLPPTAAISVGDGGTTWLLPEDIEPPTVSDISIVGVEDSGPNVSTKGAKIRFNSNIVGTYKITIPGGTDFITRVLTGPSTAGDNEVYWDGKAGLSVADPISAGIAVPPGTTLNTVKVQLYGAEVHFPFLDVEANPSGIIIEQLTTDGNYEIITGGDIVYWDDRKPKIVDGETVFVDFTGGTVPNPSHAVLGISEISSNSNGHKWGANPGDELDDYGNTKALDTYTFVPGLEIEHTVSLTISQADLEVTSISGDALEGNLNEGDEVTYTVVIKNLSNSESISDVTGATFGFEYPEGFTVTSAVLTENSGTVVETSPVTSGTAFTATLSMTSGSQATYVITGTAGASLINTSFAPTAYMLRPADIADPDATDASLLTFSGNPYTECNGSPSGSGCNNIKSADPVTILEVPSVAVADVGNIDEDQTLTVSATDGLLSNETPADRNFTINKYTIGDTDFAVATTHTISGQGTITILSDGSYEFVPAENFNGEVDVITYTVNDGLGTVLTSTLTITVNPVNDIPLASADTEIILQGAVATINTADNDSDVEDLSGSTFNFVDPTDPAVRTTTLTIAQEGNYVIVPATGVVTFTPFEGFSGITNPVRYTVTDSDDGESLPASITVTVRPKGADDSGTTTINEPVITDVKSNDGASATGTTVVIDEASTTGTLTVNSTTGAVTYAPEDDFVGTDTYTYQLRTIDGVLSDAITVTINVKPVGVEDSGETTNADPVNVITIDVLENDVDAGTGTSVSSASNGEYGNTSVNSTTGEITYTPTGNDFTGVDEFTYTLETTDGVESDPITVKVKVKPAGIADNAVTSINTPVTTNVITNDTNAGADATVSVVSSNSGTAVVSSAGQIKYTPDNNFIGEDTYTYVLTSKDGQVKSDPITVTVNVKAVGAADEDITAMGVSVTTDVKDNDGASAVGTTVTAGNGTHGTTSVDATTGAVTYDPTDGDDFTGIDTYTYTLTKDGVESDPITVRIRVKPVGTADNGTGDINTDVTTDVRNNDGPGGTTASTLAIGTVSDGSHGQTSVDATTGIVTYTPDDDFIGKDSYTYTITTPDEVESDPIRVDVEIKPVGVADAGSTSVNTAIITDVKSNDGASATGTTVIVGATSTEGGTLTVNNTTGVVTYAPATDFVGTDTYTYQLKTTDGVLSDPIEVTISVKVSGTADEAVMTAGDPSVITDVTDNDGPGSGGATITAGDGAHGTTSVDTDGNVVYTPVTPTDNFTGEDTYTYTLTVDGVESDPITVKVKVKPAGIADNAVTSINTPVTTNVITNDTNAGADATVSVVSSNSGSAEVSSAGRIKYTPDNNFIGEDTYTYVLTSKDGKVKSEPITVTVNVKAVGAADEDITAMGVSVTTDVKDNDGASAVGTTVTAGNSTHGTTSVDATTGAVTYDPTDGDDFTGIDTYTYTLTKDGVESDPIEVTIRVKPVGTADNGTGDINTDVTTDVRNNDGPGGTTSTLAIGTVSEGAHGQTSVDATTGIVTYTPDEDFIGKDSYTYTITTPDGVESDPIRVDIAVRPVGADDSGTTTINEPVITDVKSNDGASATGTTVVIDEASTTGTLTVNSTTGAVTYAPEDDFVGTDTYTYQLRTTDGVLSDAITVTINVKPVGLEDSGDTTNADPVNVITIDVLENDVDAGTGTSVSSASNGEYGNTSVNPTTGEITYTPSGNDFTGVDEFTYTLETTDGVESDPITVKVKVKPAGIADNAVTSINIPVTTNVISNDTNAGTDATVSVVSSNSGTAVVSSAGQIKYTPENNFIGEDTYSYVLTSEDGNAKSEPIIVTVNVKAVGAADEDITAMGVSVTTDVKDNDGASATGTTVTAGNGTHGTTSVDATTGAVTYDPTDGDDFTGIDTYTYTLTKDGVESDPITVRIRVKPVGTPDAGTAEINTPVITDVTDNDGPGSGTVIANDGDYGKTTVDTDGKVTYTPDEDFIGKDSYTYVTKTPDGVESDPIRVDVEIKPEGVADAGTTSANRPLAIEVKLNDDASAINTSVEVNSSSNKGGALSVNPLTGVINYTPAEDFTGQDTYTYKLKTADGVSSEEILVTVDVKPAGIADTYQTNINTPVINDVRSNDGVNAADAKVNPSDGEYGTTVADAEGKVTYTPNTGFMGTDTYTYTLTSLHDGIVSDAITVTIHVKPVASSDDNISTPINTTVIIPVKDNDDQSADGTIVTAEDGEHGTTTVNSNTKAVSYTPNKDFIGKDRYTYTLTKDGVVSEPVTVTIEVKPVGSEDQATTFVGQAVTTDVKLNDGASAVGTQVQATAGTKGTTSVDPVTGKITYTPEADFIGEDTYTYTLTIDGVVSDPILVQVSVRSVGVPDHGTAVVNTPVTIDVKTGDGPGKVKVTDGGHGTTTVDENGVVTYTPDEDFIGKDSFTYTLISEDGVESEPITVNVEISPVGKPDNGSTPINTPLVTSVRSNDGASATGTRVVVSGNSTNGGTLEVDDVTGAVTYTPALDFKGTDTYTYTLVTADGVSSEPVKVTINVRPVGVEEGVETPIGESVNIPVKDNDGASGSGTLVTVSKQPSNGSASVNEVTGEITYSPKGGFIGTDTYSYTLTTLDGIVSEPFTVTVHVKPVGTADSDRTSVNQSVSTSVKTNDGASAVGTSLAIAAAPAHGTVVVASDKVVYRPDPGYTGADSYTYILTTADGVSGDPVSVTIDVTSEGTIDVTKTAATGDYNTPGQVIEYTIVVKNTGNVPLTDVVITDPDVEITSGAPIGSLQPGEQRTLTARHVITREDIDAGRVVGQANVTANDPLDNRVHAQSSDPAGIDPDGKTITILDSGSDLMISKVNLTTGDVKPGDKVRFRIEVSNKGVNNATGVSVADVLANNLGEPQEIVSTMGSAVFNSASRTLEWTVGALAADETVSIEFTTQIIAGGDLVNTAEVSGDQSDPDVSNNYISTIPKKIIGDLFIPNVITPNGDGMNDKLEILGITGFENGELQLFNRWGNEVYKNANYRNEWDGEGLNPGTYFYILKIRGIDHVYKGWVLLKK